MSSRRRQANIQTVTIGLVATGLALAIYLTGGLDWLESKTLDLRFRYANPIRVSDDIVCIDIDDGSLEMGKGGRWPWPRDVQAALISVPAELGARAILVDLDMRDAETLRTVTPRDEDVFATIADMEEIGAERAYPDFALARAFRDCGAVYMSFSYRQRDLHESRDFDRLVDMAGQETASESELDRLASELSRRCPEWGGPDRVRLMSRMTALLERDASLTREQLAEPLGLNAIGFIERAYEPCRQAALRRTVRKWIDRAQLPADEPPAHFATDLFHELTGMEQHRETPLRAALAVALRHVLGYAATVGAPFAEIERVRLGVRVIDSIEPVYFQLARHTRRCGFVVFHSDSDGVVRRMSLLAWDGRNVFPQLALAVAADVLNLTPADIRAEPGRLILNREAQSPLVIQIDSHAQTIIPVAPPVDAPGLSASRDGFRRVPADALWQVYDRRRQIAANERLILAALRDAAHESNLPAAADVAELAGAIVSRSAQLRQLRLSGADELVADQEAQLMRLQAQLADAESRLRREVEAARESDSQDNEAIALLREELSGIEEARRINRGLQAEVSATLDRLQPAVEGRICLLGYTATALADMKPMATSPSAPGVMAHAYMLNGLLTNQLVTWAPTGLNAGLAGVLGIGITVVSVWRPPRTAFLILLLSATVFVGLAGWAAFYGMRYWIGLTPALGAMFLSFIAIAVYRYVFIDAERRQLATALSQYTSKAIARQVAENPELCRRAETRTVTSMFTDLRGFTGISERIGAERTQKVLNACLGRFTEVMLRHEAMVNKFIGDGIFAFWNPVIFPQPDHAARACETAIDLLAELDRLIGEQQGEQAEPAFFELRLRVGVATGNAVVGPCGSEQKFDYTCIGDSVNVAARLESANKFYGTQILINRDTREAVGDRFCVRPLGRVQVKGKQQGVEIFELQGRPGAVEPSLTEYAGNFGAALQTFQARDWARAADQFEALSRSRPDDLAAQQYAIESRRLLSDPPGADWNAAIELREK